MTDRPAHRFGAPLFLGAWVLALAGMVHVDWHVGRPASLSLSLGWPLHWLLGLAAGAVMAAVFARRFGSHRGAAALGLAGLGAFILGQLVQPALEAVAAGATFGEAIPPVRWSIFAAFAAAWVAGAVAGLVLARRFNRATPE